MKKSGSSASASSQHQQQLQQLQQQQQQQQHNQSNNTLAAPSNLQVRRSSAPDSNVSRKGNDRPAISPPGAGGAGLLFVGGTRSATTSPVGGAPSAVGGSAGAGDKSGSPRHRTSNDAWVCPNDRQLALRAKLQSGWSIKTANLNQWKQPDPMTTSEHEMILKVIEKAEAMERAEMLRVGRLVSRLENMKHCRTGNGETDCILCGEVFRFYHRSQKRCADCGKMTCGKCGIESSAHPPHHGNNGPRSSGKRSSSGDFSSTLSSSASFISVGGLSSLSVGTGGNKDTVWLCKICAEEKEMWKKSGAWFFKSMPKYVVQEAKGGPMSRSGRGGSFISRPFGSQIGSHFLGPRTQSAVDLLRGSGTGGGFSGNSTQASEDDEDLNSSEEEGPLARRRIKVRTRSSGKSSEDNSGPPSLQGQLGCDDYQFREPRSRVRNGNAGIAGVAGVAGETRFQQGPRSHSSASLPVTELSQEMVDAFHAIQACQMFAPNGSATVIPSNSSISPTSSIASSPAAPGEQHMPRLRPPGSCRGPPPGRSGSPRMYRGPPPGYVARGARAGSGPPPHLGGFPPQPPGVGGSSARFFRPPPPAHVVSRSPSPSPPYSPRTGPHPTPRRGPPPPGHRFRGCPPRFRGGGPPRQVFPHSAPHSPVMPHGPPSGPLFTGSPVIGYESHNHQQETATLDNDYHLVHQQEDQLQQAQAMGSFTNYQKTVDVQKQTPDAAPAASDLDYDQGEHKEDQMLDDDQHRQSTDDNAFSKFKPIAGDKENKFTSTLRRLSTVRKRNKNKKKDKSDPKLELSDLDSSKTAVAAASGGAAVATAAATAGNGNRPSSTTSRESETEMVTSGYFSRQESHSRGSDETLSSPRSPDGSYGTIELSLIYDESNELLVVNIIKAKKIRGMDINGLSDSYCKVTLVPPLGKGSHDQCTKTVHKSINPYYNACLHFGGISKEYVNKSSISLSILDEDLSGDHLLAETTLPLKKLVLPQNQKKFQMTLDKPNLKDTYEGLIVASNVGRIEIGLAFYAKSGTLKVTIIQCLELPQMEETGSANPFVQCVLHPINKNSKHVTTVKWHSLNPDFHEQFVYTVSSADLPKQSLHLTVWDREKGRPDEYIGGIILGLNCKGGRLQHWSEMIKNPGQVHKKIHYLSATFLD